MKNKILTSLMALFMLCPIYAKGQNNADILTKAEAGLRKYCKAFTTSTTPVPSSCRNNCFSSQVERNSRDWIMSIYNRPEDMSKMAIWWVGDSRTVGMWSRLFSRQTRHNEAFLAKVGEGHKWLTGTALPKLESCICDGDTVILALGANDISSYDEYIKTYNDLMDRDVKFFVVSVNPVLNAQNLTNEQISRFNSKMKFAFPDVYINTYDAVYNMLDDRCTEDGLHYNGKCGIDKKVYEVVMQKVNDLNK